MLGSVTHTADPFLLIDVRCSIGTDYLDSAVVSDLQVRSPPLHFFLLISILDSSIPSARNRVGRIAIGLILCAYSLQLNASSRSCADDRQQQARAERD